MFDDINELLSPLFQDSLTESCLGFWFFFFFFLFCETQGSAHWQKIPRNLPSGNLTS